MSVTEQPTLTDGVVWLTPFTDRDGPAIGDFNLDEEHRRWFDQPAPAEDRDARRRHGEAVAERWQRAWTTREALAFAVRLAPDGEVIGMAELQPAGAGAADISYAIAAAHRRQGYATRAVRLLSDAGLQMFGFTQIALRCDVDNAASARTAERVGFMFVGIDPGAGVFEHVDGWDAPRDERVYRRRRDADEG
jgi:RimJ/RimL family protein N-acetyltransferase